jgi:hypothetical protein
MAGYQDELAGFRAVLGWAAGALRDLPDLLPASGDGANMPGTMSQAELARVPGVASGRVGLLARGRPKHPARGHG